MKADQWFVQSIYSMSVLPDMATLPSAIVVLVVLLLLTSLLGVNLSKRFLVFTKSFTLFGNLFRKVSTQLRAYFSDHVGLLKPAGKDMISNPAEQDLMSKLSDTWSWRALFTTPLQFCRNEINLPAVLWLRFKWRDHVVYGSKWSFSLCIKHTIRVLAIPIWILVALTIASLILLKDTLISCAEGLVEKLR